MTRFALRAAVTIGAAISLLPSFARADEPMRVVVEACAFDTADLERLVRLELGSVLGASVAPSSYVVSIRCDDGVWIEIADPLTSKSLRRRVAMPPPNDPDPERWIAITVAQLYRASWLELDAHETLPERTPLPPVDPPRKQGTEAEAARREIRSLVAPAAPTAWAAPPRPPVVETGPAPSHGSLAVALGVRARPIDAPLVLPSIEIVGAWSPSGAGYWFSVTSALEHARIDRDHGTVDVFVGRGAVGAGVEPLVSGAWSGFAEATIGLGAVHVSAASVDAGFVAGSVTGAGFEATLGVGAAARVGPLRFELLARGGGLAGAPTGAVADDASIALAGLWAGGDLRARWMF